MTKILENLDDQQKIAASTIEGKSLVVAGAGSGKTTTLVRRLAYMIEQGIDPRNILLLTFTKNAAASIINRAQAFCEGSPNIQGGTFHSVASKLIRENHQIFNLPRNFTIIDPDDADSVITNLIKDHGNPKILLPKSASVHRVISLAKNKCVSISTIIEEDELDLIEHVKLIETVENYYTKYKAKYDLLDYDDLLEFWAAMMEDEKIGALVRKQFPHVMVDEYQDCNKLQLRIVYGLGKEYNKSLMCVGDPSQSIYGFRGSEPKIMFDFMAHFLDAKLLMLENNYRSVDTILDLANHIDSRMNPRFDRNMRTNRTNGIVPKITYLKNRTEEARTLVSRILEEVENKTELSDQAILIRSNRFGRHIEAELTAKRIPYVFLGGIKLNETAHIKDFLSVLKLGVNPKDCTAWNRLLSNFSKLSRKKSDQFLEDIINIGNFNNIIKYLETQTKELSSKNEIKIDNIVTILKSLGIKSWYDCLEQLKVALEPMFLAKYSDEWVWRKKDLIAVYDLAMAHQTMESFVESIALDFSVDKKTNTEASKFDSVLTLSTIHSAKGLEWKNVYIPSFIEGHMPSSMAKDEEQMEEEKRLFYVAATRAKDKLEFFKPLKSWDGKYESPVEETMYETMISDYVEIVRSQSEEDNDYWSIRSNHRIKVR